MIKYTTTIAASKTLGEMQEILARAGASRVAVEYENGQPSGLMFQLTTVAGPRVFALPVDVERMYVLMKKKGNAGQLRGISRAQWSSRDQAERVGWRIMKDWLAAQLVIIESGMVDIEQVMLPYLRVDDERTLYQSWRESELKAITSGG